MTMQSQIEVEVEEFLSCHGDVLLRFAFSLALDHGIAQDLLQDALVRVVPKWNRIEPFARHQYIRTTMVRLNIRRWSKALWRETQFEVKDSDWVADDGTQKFEVRHMLIAELRKLPRKQATAITLRYTEGLSVSDAAELMGVEQGTSKSLCSRGIEQLKQNSKSSTASLWNPDDSGGGK